MISIHHVEASDTYNVVGTGIRDGEDVFTLQGNLRQIELIELRDRITEVLEDGGGD